MNRRVIALLVLLLMPAIAYAQVARNSARVSSEFGSKTNFSSVGVQGLDTAGNPGYVELISASTTSGTVYSYYLWVDETGDLCVASHTQTSAYASFPTGNWSGPNFAGACNKVGGQS